MPYRRRGGYRRRTYRRRTAGVISRMGRTGGGYRRRRRTGYRRRYRTGGFLDSVKGFWNRNKAKIKAGAGKALQMAGNLLAGGA